MTNPSRRPFAAALFTGAALAFAAPAAAAPTTVVVARAHLIEPHVPLAASRTTGAFVVHYAAPLQFAPHAAPAAPVKALPLVAPPVPVRAAPEFLPRWGLFALPALVGADGCAAPRSGVILSALPATPFAPIACARDLSASGGRDFPTSLVPGHNKNALYGEGYSPHSLDDL